MTTAPQQLTRAHYRRLRHYWQGRAQGGASRTDTVDLELAVAGYVRRVESPSAPVFFCITRAGERELYAEHAREVARRRPHHDMAERVAAWQREKSRITWLNIELKAENDGLCQVVRPDVFSLACTYNEMRLQPEVYEVKVSRSDLLADFREPSKRGGYAMVAERVFYVAPEGIAASSEIPPECGLVVEITPGVFRVEKVPKRRRVVLTAHHFMNLILKRGDAIRPF